MRPAGLDEILRFFFRVQGRIGRAEYALGLGFIYSVNFAVLFYLLLHDEMHGLTLLGLTLLSLPLVVALAVVIAKRCHDIGLPGTFFLLILVPVLGLGWLIALAFLPGNPGPNAYGPAPEFEPE
jgi:uncharacterized membrane protein YhaH (DUF805 family)